ncbi:UNVERIFIED_CONTAM: hypothetical protein PYX00_009044 [Menopon gallinae]|uniref:Uncharacterized protein n=1 Tax=Menopon gallinae TaxID=328185 RepID=A0AAW2H9L8_9NEOP
MHACAFAYPVQKKSVRERSSSPDSFLISFRQCLRRMDRWTPFLITTDLNADGTSTARTGDSEELGFPDGGKLSTISG